MIDEKKLIEDIEKEIEFAMKCNMPDIVAGMRQIASVIEEQPKIGEWIPCSEILPKDADMRFYMCVVENHEEDLPMFCQYEEEYGFGFWNDIYDSETLGFVDTEFKTNEELGFEKVIAWQPLPEPYRPEKESEKIE